MALTADQLNTIYNNVLQRNVDFSGIQFFANRQDISDAQVRQQIELSNEAQTLVAPIVRLYDLALGRVPDSAGLKFFVNELRSGFTLEQIAQQFLNSAEYASNTTGINGTVNSDAFVTTAFNEILGRSPSAAELPYFRTLTTAAVVSQISVSPEAQQLQATNVVTFLDSAAVGSPNTGSLEAQATAAQIFTATTPETLTGGSGNDTFNGVAANVQTGDTVNGGVGTDTVQIFGATGAVVLPTLNSVEVLSLNAPTAGNLTVDASNVTGLQIAVVRNQTVAGTTTGTALVPVVVANTQTDTFTVKSGVAVGFDAVTGSAAPDAFNAAGVANITVNTEASATSQDVFLANGSSLGTVTLNGTGLTTARLDSAGTSANTVAALAVGATTKTLNITGAQKLTITGALDTDITTVNAGTDTGGVTLTASATDLTVTGGSGNDKFVFAANLGAGDTVVGGNGSDTLSITGNNFTASGVADPFIAAQINAFNTKVTGVEVLEFTGGAAAVQGGTGAGSLTNTEITKILFNTTDAGITDLVNQGGSARTYAFGELNVGSATITGINGVTTFNVALEGIAGNGGNVGTLTTDFTNAGGTQVGTGTIALASIGANDAAAPNTVDLITGTSNGAGTALTSTSVVITGAQDLTIGANQVNQVGFSSAANVNASSFTGKLTVGGSTAQDTIVSGSGVDTINATAGGDTYTGGASGDTFDFDLVGEGSANNLTTITDFAVGADKLNVAGLSNAAGTFNATAVNVTNAPDFAGSLNLAAAGDGSVNGATSYFQQGGNTFVVVDNSADTTFNATTDAVIRLTGIVTLTATDVVA